MTNKSKSKHRQPVVTVMGHVDHGKTTLLDVIQGTQIAEKEAGGITQNTRAYEVALTSGKKITFIDTPGHEAFANMRQRGAQVTDMVLLVVAADDGIQPQTKQSIEFAHKNNVPIIVAINKIDIANANIQKIKNQLSSYGVVIEEFGGDVMCFEISAKQKIGIDNLLSGIEVLSEFLELKEPEPAENTTGSAYVLESILDKKIGHIALCILKSGSPQIGNYAFQNKEIFKIRTFWDHNLLIAKDIHVSKPFYLSGHKNSLNAGEIIYFAIDEKKAKLAQSKILQNTENTKEKTEKYESELDAKSILSNILKNKKLEESGEAPKKLSIILKASTKGTLEAIESKLKDMYTEESEVKILYTGVGNVTEDDIKRAKISKSIILTFQLPTAQTIMNIARKEKVLVRNYEIIYEMFDEIAEVLESMQEPIEEETTTGSLNIKKIFILSDKSIVYGCEVLSGNVVKGNKIKILSKNGEELGRAKISSLRILKNEVKEVKKGQECGVQLDAIIANVNEGDSMICYTVSRN